MEVIFVVFGSASKEYAFLWDAYKIEVGDMIVSPDYTTPMTVKGVEKLEDVTHLEGKSFYYKAHKLKVLNPHTIIRANNSNNKNIMEEKRAVKVSLEEAKEWYKSGNNILKKLALAAFSEKELSALEYGEEIKCMQSTALHLRVAEERVAEERVLNKLANLASVYNGRWKKETAEVGYFIARGSMTFNCSSVKLEDRLEDDFFISMHINVRYPGVVYFRCKEHAIRAFKVLKEELNIL